MAVKRFAKVTLDGATMRSRDHRVQLPPYSEVTHFAVRREGFVQWGFSEAYCSWSFRSLRVCLPLPETLVPTPVAQVWVRPAPKASILPLVLERLQRLSGTRAQICLSAEIHSPVTFGVSRPILLLPEGFLDMEERHQEAIVCHELLHVRRSDWLLTNPFGQDGTLVHP